MILHRIRTIFIAFLFMALTAGAAWLLSWDPHRHSIEVNGVNRQYLFYAPRNFDGKAPLLLVFHGFSGDAERIRRSSNLHKLVNKHKFFLAYLDGDPTWRRPAVGKQCADVDFFDLLCSQLEYQHPVDSSRIYVAGMSMGGDFVIRLAGVRSNRIAAVVSQGMITDGVVEAERKYPLMVIVGTKDDRVPPQLFPAVPDAFRQRGHHVNVIRPINVGHWWHVPLNEELWSFLSEHALP